MSDDAPLHQSLSPEPLTASGAGRLLQVTPDSETSRRFAATDGAALLESLLHAHRFLVVRSPGPSVRDARRWLGQLGPPIEHDRRRDGVLELDGGKDDSEVLRGCAGMPLHKDGLLMGIDVPYVGIHCERFRSVRGGRTRVCDAESALTELEPRVIQLLREHGVEGQAVDTDYYLKEGGTWHPLPAILETERGPSLNLGLPFEPDDRPSWRVRIPGLATADSDALLAELRAVLHRPRYTYLHDWREGDLLLLANHRVLHGREPYAGDRRLANLQAGPRP